MSPRPLPTCLVLLLADDTAAANIDTAHALLGEGEVLEEDDGGRLVWKVDNKYYTASVLIRVSVLITLGWG